MPATLTKDGDELILKLAGHPNFKEALSKAKQIPGRRYNPETKNWHFPANEKVAQRLMHTVNPQPDAVIYGWLREAAQKIAEELTSTLPDDATEPLLWTPPEGLELWPFQRSMIEFGTNVEQLLIADDMGLGKTIEAIGMVQEWIRRQLPEQAGALEQNLAGSLARPKLVVAATSKIGDWRDELLRWAPDEAVMAVPGDLTAAKRKKALIEFQHELAPRGGWLIVNHEQLRAENIAKKGSKKQWVLKEPWFEQQDWLARIGDEAHRWKNPLAQQTGGMQQLSSRLTLLLTGTPIMNSPDELWAILSIIRPDLYEEWSSTKVTYWQFRNTYVEEYEIPGRGKVITGAKNTDELRFELADKMARRTKKLLREKGLLPDKLPTKFRVVPMKSAQAKLYKAAENDLWLTIERDLDELDPKEREALRKRIEKGEALESLLRFMPNAAAKYAVHKQIATSPGLIGGKDESGKLDAVVEDIMDHPGKQFVIFAWHRKTTELLAQRLLKKRIKTEIVHGGIKQLERTEVVRRYSLGETQVLAATIKAGGEGLNLTSGDTALFVERSERVTDNDQAEDRLHRLGQKNDVSIVVYQSADTIEDGSQDSRLRMKEMVIGATMGRDR